jgi:hypothetical protein
MIELRTVYEADNKECAAQCRSLSGRRTVVVMVLMVVAVQASDVVGEGCETTIIAKVASTRRGSLRAQEEKEARAVPKGKTKGSGSDSGSGPGPRQEMR